MDFLWSALAASGAAFLGTMAAFLSERFLRINDAKRVETAALNNLITDLHLRRSLAPLTPAVSYVEPNDDRAYATEAIRQIRKEIRETRLLLRPKSTDLFQALVQMSVACNEYLESVQNSPENYQFELHALREAISEAVATLGHTKDVEVREPGTGAFNQTSYV